MVFLTENISGDGTLKCVRITSKKNKTGALCQRGACKVHYQDHGGFGNDVLTLKQDQGRSK